MPEWNPFMLFIRPGPLSCLLTAARGQIWNISTLKSMPQFFHVKQHSRRACITHISSDVPRAKSCCFLLPSHSPRHRRFYKRQHETSLTLQGWKSKWTPKTMPRSQLLNTTLDKQQQAATTGSTNVKITGKGTALSAQHWVNIAVIFSRPGVNQ